jgi:putative ABC transport system permease protein
MILNDLLRLAISEISFHKIQSLLIIASVAVGIFAIFTLNSIGIGLKEEFTEITGKLGADVAIVFSGDLYSFESSFTNQDLDRLRSIPAIVDAYPVAFNIDTIESRMFWIAGMSLETYEFVEETGLYTLESGHFGVVAGAVLAEDLELEVNSIVEVADKKFRISGILKSVGNEQDDSTLYLTLEDFDRLYGESDYYMLFVRFAGEPENLEQAVDNKFRDKDVQVQTYEQLMEQITGMLDTLNIALTGVALISLIVGAITIANTVYATIKRRTREVGMLKAVGAEDDEVMWIFLFEIMILSLLGGIIGILSGYGVALLITEAIKRFVAFQPSTDPVLVFGSLLVALLVGPLSALIPALYAARLSPTEALRYE